MCHGGRRRCAGSGFEDGVEQVAEIFLDRVEFGFSDRNRVGQFIRLSRIPARSVEASTFDWLELIA
jgi:hypothetical protein